jgi:hypothetical protein
MALALQVRPALRAVLPAALLARIVHVLLCPFHVDVPRVFATGAQTGVVVAHAVAALPCFFFSFYLVITPGALP